MNYDLISFSWNPVVLLLVTNDAYYITETTTYTKTYTYCKMEAENMFHLLNNTKSTSTFNHVNTNTGEYYKKDLA